MKYLFKYYSNNREPERMLSGFFIRKIEEVSYNMDLFLKAQ